MQGLSSSGFPPHRPRFELYCFDLDDTLVQTSRHVSTHLYPQLAERFAFPTPTDQEIAQHWGKPLAESLRALFPGCQNIDALVDTLRQLHMQDPIPAAPRAKTILDILRRHGRHVAVYSSGDPVLVKATLQRSLRVRPKDFAAVYLLAEHGEQKETSGVLDRIRAEVRRRIGISIEPTSVLVVGDDPRDSVPARQGGACFRAVSSGYYNADAYASQGIPKDRVFPDLAAAMAQPVDHGVVGIIQDTYGRFLLVCEGRPDNPYFGYWSGPHGRCVAEDVLEEESVVREVREELGVEIRLIRPVYTRTADTKVRTVTFWLAELADAKQEPKNACPQEISDVRWFDLEAIRSGNLSLYPGTRDFFDRFGAEPRRSMRKIGSPIVTAQNNVSMLSSIRTEQRCDTAYLFVGDRVTKYPGRWVYGGPWERFGQYNHYVVVCDDGRVLLLPAHAGDIVPGSTEDFEFVLRRFDREAQRPPAPMTIELDPTYRCTSKDCGGRCFSAAYRALAPRATIPTQLMCELIHEFAADGGRVVRFDGGGDPLSHPAVRNGELPLLARQLEIKTTILTSGDLLAEADLPRIGDADLGCPKTPLHEHCWCA